MVIETVPFGVFCDRLLAEYQGVQRRPKTRKAMERVLRRLGSLVRGDGTPLVLSSADLCRRETVSAFIASYGSDANRNTMKGRLSYMRTACSFARDCDLAEESPFDRKKLSKWVRPQPPARKTHHSTAEVSRFLKHLDESACDFKTKRLRAFAYTLGYVGARLMEVAHLKIEDVVIADRAILIAPSVELKTEQSSAPLPICDCLLGVLKAWLPEVRDSEWVFPAMRGDGPWDSGNSRDRPSGALRLAGERIGIEGMNALSLRHSCASLLEAHGVPEIIIQRILRHTNPITQKRYRHADVAALNAHVATLSYDRP